MANDTTITIIGTLTADPELRFTQAGAAVSSFTIASNPRHFDKNKNEWVDDPALFMRCSAWRAMAENIAEGLHKGDRVIAQGRLQQRSFETREGDKRTVIEMQVDDIGPSAKFAGVRAIKAARSSSEGSRGRRSSEDAVDPWDTGSDDPWPS